MKLHFALLSFLFSFSASACLHHQPLEEMHKWFNHELELTQGKHLYGTLATVTQELKPATRIVQFVIDDEHMVKFYTHESTNKVNHLAHNPNVSFNVWLKEQGRQVTLEGQVNPLSYDELEKVWNTMPRWMQLKFIASDHKNELTNKTFLQKALAELEQKYPEFVPMPEEFVGYAISSDQVTFYEVKVPDFSDKTIAKREGDHWVVAMYQP